MKNLFDHWVPIDLAAALMSDAVSEAKRGSKRICGRIVNYDRDKPLHRQAGTGKNSPDLFFDSRSPISPWHK